MRSPGSPARSVSLYRPYHLGPIHDTEMLNEIFTRLEIQVVCRVTLCVWTGRYRRFGGSNVFMFWVDPENGDTSMLRNLWNHSPKNTSHSQPLDLEQERSDLKVSPSYRMWPGAVCYTLHRIRNRYVVTSLFTWRNIHSPVWDLRTLLIYCVQCQCPHIVVLVGYVCAYLCVCIYKEMQPKYIEAALVQSSSTCHFNQWRTVSLSLMYLHYCTQTADCVTAVSR